jgi:octaprenyl-diphosphate synthase
MLRPTLILLTAEACGGVQAMDIDLAAAVELIHTATLIHDDLIDDAETRRGRPTAHKRWGNTTSVLLGDYLYTQAFDLAARLREPELMIRLTTTTNVLCTGELHQQLVQRDTGLGESEYFEIIYAKTAALCELSGWLGARRAGPAVAEAAATYGRACGMAFQIVDDCLDFSGDPQKVGKTLLTDAERGRMTLPVLRALAALPATGRAELARLIDDGADPQALRAAIISAGGVASAETEALQQIATARSALAALPDSPARAQLDTLASFIVARDR